jgi:hypothetical protein
MVREATVVVGLYPAATPMSMSPLFDVATSGRLVPDVGIHDPYGLLRDSPTRVTISAGTQAASDLGLAPYRQAAFVPRGPWRSPSSEEEQALLADRPPSTIGSHITLVRAPADVMAHFAGLRELLEGGTTSAELPAWLEEHPCTDGRQAMLSYARRFVRADEPALEGAAIIHKAPGLSTVTTDGATGEHIGLHVDNWYGASLPQREHAPNRISINLGPEPRFFLYVNLRLITIANVITACFPEDTEARDTQHGLRIIFMSRCSSYPVVRVRLDPGEGYIAPTESVIHDASSEGTSTPDVQFLVRGRFWPD